MCHAQPHGTTLEKVLHARCVSFEIVPLLWLPSILASILTGTVSAIPRAEGRYVTRAWTKHREIKIVRVQPFRAAKNNAPIRQSPSRPRNIGAYGTPGNTTSFFAAQPLIVCLQPSLQCDPLAVLVELLLRLSRTWTEEPASYASTQCNMYYWDPIPASMCRKPAAAPILEAVNRRARVEVHASLYVPG